MSPMSTFEEVFSSRGRSRIIAILAKVGELNVSEISRRARLNHSTVKEHLKFLKEVNLVEEKVFGRIRIYRFRSETVYGRAIKNLVELWDSDI